MRLAEFTPQYARTHAVDAARPLYVCRKLLNPGSLLAWVESQGVPDLYAADKLHVTIAYSSRPVRWSQAIPDRRPLRVPAGPRRLACFGDTLVLRFVSPALHARWAALRAIGCSWDHDDYRPHVSLSAAGNEIDFGTLAPYKGDLVFGPEQFSVIDAGWSGADRETE